MYSSKLVSTFIVLFLLCCAPQAQTTIIPLTGAGGSGPVSGGGANPAFNWENTQTNAFIASATSTNVGTTNPTGTTPSCNANELLIAQILVLAASETVTGPGGWTQGDTFQDTNYSGGTLTYVWFWHVCTGSEGNSFAFSWGTSAGAYWTLQDYTAANTSTPIDAHTAATWTSGTTNFTTASVTPSASTDLLVLLAYCGDPTTLTAPADMTGRYAQTQGNSTAYSMAGDRTAGATTAQTETFTIGTTFRHGGYALIALKH